MREIQVELLARFDKHNKPTRLYIDHLNEILAKTISEEEVKVLQNKFKSGKFAFIGQITLILTFHINVVSLFVLKVAKVEYAVVLMFPL